MARLTPHAALLFFAATAAWSCTGTGTNTRDATRDPRALRKGSVAAADAGDRGVPEAPPAVVHPPVGKKPRVVVRATARAIAVDATHVYYGDSANDGVYAIPKAGGEAVRLARRAAVAGAIAVDGATLTWIASPGDAVLRVALRGGGQPITLRDRGIFSDVVSVGGDVFIVEALGAGGALTRVTGATAARLASFDGPPRTVLADDTHAYVVTPTKIFRTPHEKGPLETIATGSGFAHAQIDDAFVYVVAEAGSLGTVARFPKTGGPMTTLARDVRNAPIEVDGGEVFFFDGAHPQIRAVKTTGGEPRTVAEDDALTGAAAIAADATTVFVATGARESAAIVAVARQ